MMLLGFGIERELSMRLPFVFFSSRMDTLLARRCEESIL